MTCRSILLSFAVVLAFTATDALAQPRAARPLFEFMTPERTGVRFANTLVESDSFNVSDFIYAYNGSGVAVGDVDGDSRPDLYFVGTQVASRLYLNRGDFRFEDATYAAGLADSNGMANGVSMVDIDVDGDLDIYVCKQNRPNRLFINDGKGRFIDRAREFGLDYNGSATHAGYIDYDRDGDLDIYLGVNGRAHEKDYVKLGMTDRLYRNNGNNTFTDVSAEAGIRDVAYALSISIGDLNSDGWPDIYVANDFEHRDLVYLNNRNGTFTESMKQVFDHVAQFSMGSDIADFNNDGLLDVVAVDMAPEDHTRRTTQMGQMPVYSPAFDSLQLVQNMLQLNRGNGTFSDIAGLSGVLQTDWSWAALFADFDNDGWKDLFIGTGIKRDINDQDYVYNIDKRLTSYQLSLKMPSTRLLNYIYRNNGDLTFTNKSVDWGMDQLASSNGAAYVDLDSDGDLDLVVNNVDTAAFVYRNLAREQGGGNYLRIAFVEARPTSPGANPSYRHTPFQGTRVEIVTRDTRQTAVLEIGRGFLSSVEQVLHFGVGSAQTIDTMRVTFPWRNQPLVMTNITANQLLNVLPPAGGSDRPRAMETSVVVPLLQDHSDRIAFRHKENAFDDFKRERLLPNRLSQSGPGAASGDVNGDGLEDLYIGGAKFQSGALFLQRPDGSFAPKQVAAFEADAKCEDMGALLFDVDGDRDLDLYVASGGNDAPENDSSLQDRLYVNNGRGEFMRNEAALPSMITSTASVAGSDYDGDGDIDLFVAGRSIPGRYPLAPRSYLLRNDKGRFTDVTAKVAPALVTPGLLTAAVWSDFDGDGDSDIVTAGEWSPVRFYRNDKGTFVDASAASGISSSTGWWNSLVSGDFDNDGDIDYVAGNLGLNSRYRATPSAPIDLYANDYDNNGSLDLVMAYWQRGIQYPVRMKQAMTSQMPTLSRRFPTFKSYAMATLEQMFTRGKLDSAMHLQATTFASSYIENLGGGRFAVEPLPNLAQIAPTYGMIAQDFDADGNLDILLGGNFLGPDGDVVRYDAGQGLLMLGDGKGSFRPLEAAHSGFMAQGAVRSMVQVCSSTPERSSIVVVNNNGSAQLFISDLSGRNAKLWVPPAKTQAQHGRLKLANGTSRRVEFSRGTGYLGASVPVIVVPAGANVEVGTKRGR